MSDFAVNDLVIIVKQPSNYHIDMQGLSGYIEEINGDYAQFVSLDNRNGGCGSVPLSCLKLANDDVNLQSLKLAKDEKSAAYYKEITARTQLYNDKLDDAVKIASLSTGVSKSNVRMIFDYYQEFLDDWNSQF